MSASPNEVQMILDAISRLHNRVDVVDRKVDQGVAGIGAMDQRINGRIRKLEKFRWQMIAIGTAVVATVNIAVRFL